MSVEIPGPFRLPLSRDQFAAALARGHGRAVMHAAAHGFIGLEDAFLDACLHSKAYDAECEDSRAEWLMEILTAAAARHADAPSAPDAPRAPDAPSAPDQSRDRKEATPPDQSRDRKGATTPDQSRNRKGATPPDQSRDRKGATSGYEWEFEQQFLSRAGKSDDTWDLRICNSNATFYSHWLPLARRGSQRARELLYSLVGRDHDGSDPLAASQIVELDGEAGLQFVTKHVNGLPDGQARFGEYLDYLRRVVLPEREGREPEQAHDPQALEQRKQARAEKFRAVSAAKLIEEIESDDDERKRYWYRSWSIHADDASRRQVAGRMLSETKTSRLLKYLTVFVHRPVPVFDSRLLAFAEHEDKEVRRLAMYMLGQLRQPEVRNLALRYARACENDNTQLQLFRRNYQPGDWQVIKANLRLPSDPFHLHSIFLDLQDIYGDNPDAEEPMRLLYEHDPCSLCRFSAIRRLIEQERAPAWLLDECRHDCYEDTRKLASAR